MRSLGHIKEAGDGVFRIVLSAGHDAAGKRVRRWVTIKGTKRDAEKRLAELQREYDTGAYIPAKVTVAGFLERWLAEYAKPNLSPRAYERYSGIIKKHLIPDLGSLLLSSLRPEHIQRHYVNKLADGLSTATVCHHHAILHRALDTAQKWGLVARNMADSVEVPRIKRAEMQVWNELEIRRFLEVAKESEYYSLFHLALYSGMRRSELLGLKWADVDFIMSEIRVVRSLHYLRGKGFIFTEPKTAKSRRSIALSPAAILTLQAHRDKVAMDREVIGVPLTDDDLVFCHPGGKPYWPNSITLAWERTAARVGIKIIRFHDSRHTHASLLLKQGVHPKIVQERLGHASIQITLDTYSHVAPGLQQAAAAKFDEALGRNWVESDIKLNRR